MKEYYLHQVVVDRCLTWYWWWLSNNTSSPTLSTIWGLELWGGRWGNIGCDARFQGIRTCAHWQQEVYPLVTVWLLWLKPHGHELKYNVSSLYWLRLGGGGSEHLSHLFTYDRYCFKYILPTILQPPWDWADRFIPTAAEPHSHLLLVVVKNKEGQELGRNESKCF
jgi:hypothetical protein